MTRNRLIMLVAAIGVMAAIAKVKFGGESEWHGLTESEARARLDAKLPDKIPADKRAAIADKLVDKMRDRGVITDDPTVPDDASGLADPDPVATH